MIVNKTCPTCGTVIETYRNPFPAADVLILREGRVLLIRRRNPPPGWALPGGFIDYGETAEAAAIREAKEETGLTVTKLTLFDVRSDPARDPRFHTLTMVYRAEVEGEVAAGDDAAEARWFAVDALPEEMAFDHREVIVKALTK